MADYEYRFVTDGAEMAELLRGPNGPVLRDLNRRAQKLQLLARAQVDARAGRPTALAADITKRPTIIDGMPAIMVGSWNKDYALFVHDGTAPHDIRPKTKKALAFFSGGFGGKQSFLGGADAPPIGRVVGGRTVNVVVRVVHHPGTKANRFLSDNLHVVAQ